MKAADRFKFESDGKAMQKYLESLPAEKREQVEQMLSQIEQGGIGARAAAGAFLTLRLAAEGLVESKIDRDQFSDVLREVLGYFEAAVRMAVIEQTYRQLVEEEGSPLKEDPVLTVTVLLQIKLDDATKRFNKGVERLQLFMRMLSEEGS